MVTPPYRISRRFSMTVRPSIPPPAPFISKGLAHFYLFAYPPRIFPWIVTSKIVRNSSLKLAWRNLAGRYPATLCCIPIFDNDSQISTFCNLADAERVSSPGVRTRWFSWRQKLRDVWLAN